MSANYLNRHLATIPSKRKNKYPVTKPSFLISETSNKIIQTIEEKLRIKKSSSSKSTNAKQSANNPKPVMPITRLPKSLKGKKARSTNRLSSSASAVTASTMFTSQVNVKSPKSNSIAIKRSPNHPLPQSVNAKMELMRKRDCSLENNTKAMVNSSSYHMKNSNKSAVISPNRDNNRLLTSASFTGNKPSLDAFKPNQIAIKHKRGINVKRIPLNESKKDEAFNNNHTVATITTATIPDSKSRKGKDSTPVHIPKKGGYIPVNSLKNMTPNSVLLSKSNKANSSSDSNNVHLSDSKHEHNDLNNNSTVTKEDQRATTDVFKTIENENSKFSSSSPMRKFPATINSDTVKKTDDALNIKVINQNTVLSDIVSQTIPNTSSGTSNSRRSANYKKVVNIDSFSKAGFSAPGVEKINQDNYFITQHFLNEPEQYFLGICDGHGNSGHLASEFIVNSLPDKLLELVLYEKPITDIHQNLIEGFSRLHNELIDNHEIDTKFSGTTCISTIISKEKIVCANLGDSRAVLGRWVKGEWKAINLSRDHKASEPDESMRIIKRGGRIASYIDEKTKESVGPQRVWLKEADIPGLAMTRSFGDQIAHCVGVICEPEINEHSFQGGEKFIVLGSDGIWEFIDSEECVHIVKDYYLKGDVSGACAAIIDEAFNRWIKDQDVVDDITVIIAFLD